jgi:hypothetical protein
MAKAEPTLDGAFGAWKAAYAGTEQTPLYAHVNAAQLAHDAAHADIGTNIAASPENGAHDAHTTYRHEYIRCGKSPCKRCDGGPGHGPYWYAYSRVGGKLTKRYIGKRKPS